MNRQNGRSRDAVTAAPEPVRYCAGFHWSECPGGRGGGGVGGAAIVAVLAVLAVAMLAKSHVGIAADGRGDRRHAPPPRRAHRWRTWRASS